MRVLLTSPAWSRKDESNELSSVVVNRFNFGFACLSGYLKARGHDVVVAEPLLMTALEYENLIKDGKFGVVGITTWTSAILKVYETAELIKKLSPSSHVVLGGVHATLFPERTLRECFSADFVITGEGEKPLLSLVEMLDKKQSNYQEIPSLIYKRGLDIAANPRASFLTPEEFPFPDYVGAHLTKFQCNPPLFKCHPTYTLSFSRGCPLNCAFCNANEVLGRSVRIKPVSLAIQELKYLKETLGARGFAFLDSTFTFKKGWVLEFCKEYKREINLPWCCFSRVDCIDEELVKEMKDSGCWQIGFGIESANEKTLSSMQKGTTVAQNEAAVMLCKKHKVRVYASFILGWPGESYTDVLNTLRWAKKTRPHVCIFNIPHPYPESKLRALCLKDGGLKNDEYHWATYDLKPLSQKPIYINPLIGEKKMPRLEKMAYIKHYFSFITLYYFMWGLTKDQFRALFSQVIAYLRILKSSVGLVICRNS